MTKCTLHNLLTSCQYPQVFWIYQMNDYDENILLTKGTKQEMLEDDENNFDLIDHINDVVKYWAIREDGAMFIRLRMDDRAKELYLDDYVERWDRFNPTKRPYLYSAEMDDFTHHIYGSSEYLYPYGDPTSATIMIRQNALPSADREDYEKGYKDGQLAVMTGNDEKEFERGYRMGQAADRPKGEWIDVTNGRGGHECSECHSYAPSYASGDEHLSDFCPNCGAKMGGDSE